MSQHNALYNPANQTADEVVNNFVIRGKEFKQIMQTLQGSKRNTPAQHFLIEGQRGTGKTFLLLRVRTEIEHDKKLSHLLPVQFAEEQYGVFDLCHLWEQTAKELEEQKGFEDMLDVFDEQLHHPDYAKTCFSILEDYLVKNKKKLVLLVDNIGDILDKLPFIEQQRLSDILRTSPHIQLLSASSRSLDYLYQHAAPFDGLFDLIHLTGLSQQDTQILLIKLAESADQTIKNRLKQQPERIETMRRLTGGIPRTIVLLYEIFLDNSGKVFGDLEKVLDNVTPLYKHRMDDLSTQQQAIMNTLALNWDGMETKEITLQLQSRGLTSKKISAQLRLLEKNTLVSSVTFGKKNKLYQVKERFFNIWYLMRYGRKKNKENVRWLVRFLEEWCSPEEITYKVKQHIEYAKQGTLDPYAYYIVEGLAQQEKDEALQHELITITREKLRSCIPDIDSKLSLSDKERWEKIWKASEEGNTILAINHLTHLINKKNIKAMAVLGDIYYEEYENFEKAVDYYKMAIAKGSSHAMCGLAKIYKNEYKNFEKAIHYYKMAIEKKCEWAMFYLARIYENEYKDFEKSVVHYKMAAEKDNEWAMLCLAELYRFEYKEFDKAVIYYKILVKKGNVDSMVYLANTYRFGCKDFEKAVIYYKMAIEKGHKGAINHLADLYRIQYKDPEKAVIYYKMAIDKNHIGAMISLADIYREKYKDFERSVMYYKMAVENKNITAMNILANIYYEKNINKKEGLTLSEKAYLIGKDIYNTHTLATILLWNNDYHTSINTIKKLFNLSDYSVEEWTDEVTAYFIFLLAKKQLHPAHELFNEFSDLKQQFKPVYYALMTLLKDEYPKEYLKMGTELEETVQEILEAIKKKAKKYA